MSLSKNGSKNHPIKVRRVKSIRLLPEELRQMAEECSSPPKRSKVIPKSTYEGREVPYATEFVERIRTAYVAKAAQKARAAQVFGKRGMRETDFGPDLGKEPRGRHRQHLENMERGVVSRRHDHNCRVCEPSKLVHAPDCPICRPMTAYAQGGHRLQPEIMNYLPITMRHVRDAQRNNYVPPHWHFEDAWRRMKIAREDRAADLREHNSHV